MSWRNSVPLFFHILPCIFVRNTDLSGNMTNLFFGQDSLSFLVL